MATADPRELWLITGSQHLYGEEAIDTVATNARQVATVLSNADGMPAAVIAGSVVTTVEAVKVLCRQANEARRCIGVIFWMPTVSATKMWARGLQELRKPFCYLHGQHGRAISRSSGHRPTVIVGHYSEPTVAKAIVGWARATSGAFEARNLAIAALGEDPSTRERFGFRVTGVGSNALSSQANEVSDREIRHLTSIYEESYDVAPELGKGGSLHEELRAQARVELGLIGILSGGGYGGFTTPPTPGGSVLSGLAVQRVMAAGYGFGPQGDWMTAALVRILKSMGRGPGGTTFLEDSTYVRQTSGMAVFGAHMLEVCPSVADQRRRPRIEILAAEGRLGVPRLAFSAPPGSAVNTGLFQVGGRLQLVANAVRAGSQEVVPVTSIPLAPYPDLGTAADCWALAGGARHTALTTNVAMHVLETWAGILGIGYLGIDAQTSLRSFKRLMRGVIHEFS